MDLLRSLGTTSLRTAVTFTVSGLATVAVCWWALTAPDPSTALRVLIILVLAVGTVMVIVNGASAVHLLRHPHCRMPPLVRSPRMLNMQRWFSISVVTVLFIPSTNGFERGHTGPIVLVVAAVISAMVSAAMWLGEYRRARGVHRSGSDRSVSTRVER